MRQVNGGYEAKEHRMAEYLKKVREKVAAFREFEVKQVPRAKNASADALSQLSTSDYIELGGSVYFENESITEMFTRFTDIVNSLRSLGKTYTNAENIRKILRALPTAWRPKKTAIEEAKDLTKISLDYLLGSLQTHEVELKADKPTPKNKIKTIALKTSQTIEEVSDDEDDEEFNMEKEISLITKKFNKFFKKKGRVPYKNKTHSKMSYGKKVRLKNKIEAEWVIDSGCSKHMTSTKNLFSSLQAYNRAWVSFGDDSKGKIARIGRIKLGDISISNVYYVRNLNYNLLSLSQLCGIGYKLEFDVSHCYIKDANNDFILK
ncbi:uncharacterized protein LOC122089599 [Macadamia integrifolia]|uniref:uncharacterized protein LOC122089599 n=1 Tax=Macadamia integrifolia TaxID=60698 RepID=UPI001C4EFA98|nr:uncharacterized protein LOC122089599 [Macadamia integrifolia]